MHYKSQNIYGTLSCTLHQQNHLINNPGIRHYVEKKNTSESYFFIKTYYKQKQYNCKQTCISIQPKCNFKIRYRKKTKLNLYFSLKKKKEKRSLKPVVKHINTCGSWHNCDCVYILQWCYA